MLSPSALAPRTPVAWQSLSRTVTATIATIKVNTGRN
jgi:hypothetical protein